MKKFWFVLIALVLVLSVAAPAMAAPPSPAPLYGTDSADAIPGRYIVVFKSNASAKAINSAASLAKSNGGSVSHNYSAALKGFAGSFNAKAIEGLRNNPNVAYIEADQAIRLSATQSGATWGLDRIDQTSLPLNGSYTYNYTGAGVTAYIIDTGINYNHNDFGGRASFGFDAFGGNGSDCNGHGTHVAGTVGGGTYGVAKSVTLKAVRVLDCAGSGSNAGVIAGVDWVTANAAKPAVANMSLGGSKSTALDSAVTNSINSGVTYAVAAGNSNRDACSFSPARAAAAITVGATTSTDARASYSNYGSCLDIFAPGSSITSAWYTSNSATNTISGTSMASPHVAGVAALYLQRYPTASPTTVRNAIVNSATSNKVTSAGRNSPNKLLFALIP